MFALSVRSIARVTPVVAFLAGCGGGESGAGGGGSTSGGGGTDGGVGGAAGTAGAPGGGASGADAGATSCDDVGSPDEVLSAATDPEAGLFTLEEALAGLDGPGPLRARISTEKGELSCELFAEEAPNAVANFVGLARGVRPWKDPVTKQWVRRRFYDGLKFHRVIDDFMAQGGDPLGTGTGGPGYKLADEISDLVHEPGTLAYANSGPDTNGSQFYITEVKADWIDGQYVIFGRCEPLTVVQAITAVAVDAENHPVADVHTLTVRISKCAP